MATVKIIILKHQRREDNTWNVKIRITHERQSSYIATTHYVGSELINKKTFELKERNNPIYDQVMLDVLKEPNFQNWVTLLICILLKGYVN